MITVRGRAIATLFSQEEIAAEIERLAGEIAATAPDDLLVVAVLKGSFVFAADLIRALHRAGVAPEVEFISLSSYGAGTTGGATLGVPLSTYSGCTVETGAAATGASAPGAGATGTTASISGVTGATGRCGPGTGSPPR